MLTCGRYASEPRVPRVTIVYSETMTANKRFELVLPAARRGEEWALSALYRGLQPALLGYLRSRRPNDAEDVASETWISVASGLGTFHGNEDGFRRWVFTIARRRLIDLARAESRRPPTATGAASLDESNLVAPDAETDALAALATRQALEYVASLPPKEAEVILLRVIAGLSTDDVASITGRSSVAVRVAQHRALRRLAKTLGKTLVTVQSRLAI